MNTQESQKGIDWSKERTVAGNYCGYCTNTPSGGSCDGSCFTRKDFSDDDKLKFKITHLKEQLTSIRQQRKELNDRRIAIMKEIDKIVFMDFERRKDIILKEANDNANFNI
jgi:hypothetical protein